MSGGARRKGAGVRDRNSNVRISLLDLPCVLILMHISTSLTWLLVRMHKRSFIGYVVFLSLNQSTMKMHLSMELGGW